MCMEENMGPKSDVSRIVRADICMCIHIIFVIRFSKEDITVEQRAVFIIYYIKQ